MNRCYILAISTYNIPNLFILEVQFLFEQSYVISFQAVPSKLFKIIKSDIHPKVKEKCTKADRTENQLH